jgi:periplasmic glucans biosynthesis protein
LVVSVKATLFARQEIQLVGVAPLTSMFFYGENTDRPRGEWRAEVHDSDGLLVHDGASGEWLWRPVINPRYLEMDYFATNNVRGFGLLQRDVDFRNYQDLGAGYHLRPSTWVSPIGDWGPGKVVLVQLPTPQETNDNIVAFWTPEHVMEPGKELALAYDLRFGKNDLSGEQTGHVVNTFVGDGNIIGGGTALGAYRISVDFAGGELDKLSPRSGVMANVTALDGGEIIEQYVEYNAELKTWRLSILAKPAPQKSLILRAYLQKTDSALSETWTYRLPPDNGILRQKE